MARMRTILVFFRAKKVLRGCAKDEDLFSNFSTSITSRAVGFKAAAVAAAATPVGIPTYKSFGLFQKNFAVPDRAYIVVSQSMEERERERE